MACDLLRNIFRRDRLSKSGDWIKAEHMKTILQILFGSGWLVLWYAVFYVVGLSLSCVHFRELFEITYQDPGPETQIPAHFYALHF